MSLHSALQNFDLGAYFAVLGIAAAVMLIAVVAACIWINRHP